MKCALRMRVTRGAILGLAMCCASGATAATPVSLGGELFSVAVSLCAVIAAIFAAAWAARRFGAVGRLTGQRVKTLAATGVGGRERVVLIEVNGVQLLIGVSPGSVRTLHRFSPDEVQTFAATLQAQTTSAPQ